MDNVLAAKVEAVNKANAYAMEIHPQLVEALRPFVRKKVVKKGGALLVKVATSLPTFSQTQSLSVYRARYGFRLEWTVKTCVGVKGLESCVYHETGLFVGVVNDGILIELHTTPPVLRTNYTVEEIEQGRETCRLLREQLRAAESDISMFGYHQL